MVNQSPSNKSNKNIDNKSGQNINRDEEEQKLDKEIIKQVENSDIPKDKQEYIIAAMSMYSGPIPHPEILAGYEELDKGAAKKIIDNGIAESVQRRKLEEARQKRRGKMAWASLFVTAIFVLSFTIGAFYLVLNNHVVIGSASGIIALFSLIGGISENVDKLSGNDDLTNNNDHDNTE
ncbi:MAG: DUF2335 domain-containing protein [Gilliamella sp.]|nr:DUF2335 domain-containing protein [Gilliamella sp.]